MDFMNLFRSQKGNIATKELMKFNQKTQQVHLGEKKMVTCKKCNATFKLSFSIPVKNNKIHCVKCKDIIEIVNVNISDNPTLVEIVNIVKETECFPEMYKYIERYYQSKNEEYQHAIAQVCLFNKRGFRNDHYLQETIDRLSLAISDKENLGHDDINYIQTTKNTIKFYNDIRNFREYFSTKGITTTYNQILAVFDHVQTKHIQMSNERHRGELFEVIKQRVINDESEYGIAKQFIKLTVERGEGDILDTRCVIDLPQLLQDFGFQYNEYTDKLNQLCVNIIKELKAEAFENSFDSSYDEWTHRGNDANPKRLTIPTNVKREVWRRDQGRCAKCESRDSLEYDHIIPVSKGGSNTARNIELLCQLCNRKKSADIT